MLSDFSKPAKEILLDLLVSQNPGAIALGVSADKLVFGEPVAAVGLHGPKDTDVTVTGTPGEGFIGSVVINYNRVDLSTTQSNTLYVSLDEFTTYAQLLPQINAGLRLNLVEGDIVDAPFEVTELGGAIQVDASEQNLVFVASLYAEIMEPSQAELALTWRENEKSDPGIVFGMNVSPRLVIVGPVTEEDNFTFDLQWTAGLNSNTPPLIEYYPESNKRSAYVVIQNNDDGQASIISSGTSLITLLNNGVPVGQPLKLIVSDIKTEEPFTCSIGTYLPGETEAVVTKLEGSGSITLPLGVTNAYVSGTNSAGTSAIPPINWFSTPAVASGNGMFVTTGSGQISAISEDGITWISNPEGNNYAGGNGKLMFANGLFVYYSPSNNVILVTVDGITWSPTNRSNLTANWVHIFYGGGYFVATSTLNEIMVSVDGITWTSHIGISFITNNMVYGNGEFVSIQGNFAYRAEIAGGELTLIQAVSLPVEVTSVLDPVLLAFGGGVYVASSASSTYVAYSTDGIVWTAVDLGFAYETLAYVGDRFMLTAYGNTTEMHYSLDGVNWVQGETLANTLRILCELNGTIISMGLVSNFGLAVDYSTDGGLTWTRAGQEALFGPDASVLIDGNEYVIPGINDPYSFEAYSNPVSLDPEVEFDVDYECPTGTNVYLIYYPPQI